MPIIPDVAITPRLRGHPFDEIVHVAALLGVEEPEGAAGTTGYQRGDPAVGVRTTSASSAVSSRIRIATLVSRRGEWRGSLRLR
jgi:hypothetical protein